jgi:outer membrane receptor protein involved in Fe transport
MMAATVQSTTGGPLARLALAATLLLPAAAAQGGLMVLPDLQVTAGRGAQPLSAVPQPVTVVNAADIERATPQVVGDLLRGQPGVFLQSSGPGQGVVIVRGLKVSEVLHLVDGMRLNMAFFRNSPSQYLALVDPYNIERIELLRGPGAVLYGSDALGGVLQMFTPEYQFGGDALQFDGQVRALYGSADLARIGRAELALGRSGLSLSGGVTHMEYGAREIADGGRQPFTAYPMRGGDAKLLWSPRSGQELMLSAQFMTAPRLPRYFEIVGGPGGAGSGLPVFFEPSARRFVHARYRVEAPWTAAEQLEIHIARQIIDDDRVRQVDDRSQEEERNRSNLTGLTLQAISQHRDLRWTYGLDIYRDRIDSGKQRRSLDTQAVSPGNPAFPDGARTLDFGIYLDTEWQATPQWLLQLGARYNRIDTDLPATAASPAARIANADITAHLGAAFALTPSLRWTSNLSRGFRAPNLFDLGTLGPRPNTSPQVINVPNPDLGKETVVSLDTGLKWRTPDWRFEFAVFRSWNDNRIEPREPTGTTLPQGQFGCEQASGCPEVRSENLSSARFWGIETGLRARLTSNTALQAALNYTYGEERREDSTGPANRVPPLHGQLGLVYEPGAELGIEPYLRFAGAQDRLDDDDRNDVRIDPQGTPGWVSANLRVIWTPGPHWRWQLEGTNLLDRPYREHGSGIDAAGVGLVLGTQYRF